MTTLADLTWPVRTERLTIRPLRPTDAEAAWAFRGLPEVGEWLGTERTDRAGFEEAFLRPDRLATTLALEHAHDGHLVGDLMLRVGDAWGQSDVAEQARGSEAELGWVLHPAYGGRGLATEAVRALVGLALDEAPAGLGLRRVTASCFVANTASWRLMERVGMRREQHGVADSLHRDHGWIDGCTYALLAPEWRAMSERC